MPKGSLVKRVSSAHLPNRLSAISLGLPREGRTALRNLITSLEKNVHDLKQLCLHNERYSREKIGVGRPKAQKRNKSDTLQAISGECGTVPVNNENDSLRNNSG